MITILFTSLYVELFASIFILLFLNINAGWIYFIFLFIATFGGFLLINRPVIIATGFLMASLAVMWWGYFALPSHDRNIIALGVTSAMSAISAFTIVWLIFKTKSASPGTIS